jgi:hypothetical protein
VLCRLGGARRRYHVVCTLPRNDCFGLKQGGRDSNQARVAEGDLAGVPPNLLTAFAETAPLEGVGLVPG